MIGYKCVCITADRIFRVLHSCLGWRHFSWPSHRDKSHMAWLPLIILFVLKGIFEPFAITPFLQPKWRSCWLLGFCSGLWKAPQAAASRAWKGAINVNSVLNPHIGIHHLSHTSLHLPPHQRHCHTHVKLQNVLSHWRRENIKLLHQAHTVLREKRRHEWACPAAEG